MSKILEFSEMISTKFSHDLSGAISAIANGIELMEEVDDHEIKAKAYDLVKKNSEEVGAKLKFFRSIYGMASTEGESDISEIKKLCEEFAKDGKIQIIWNNDMTGSGYIQLTSRAAKLLLSLFYIMHGLLIYGGVIKISLGRNSENKKQIIVEGEADRIKDFSDVQRILLDHELQDMKLNNVHIHLAAKIASDLMVVVKANELTPTKISLEVDF
jgi:histidine phosphotransferase ChpT